MTTFGERAINGTIDTYKKFLYDMSLEGLIKYRNALADVSKCKNLSEIRKGLKILELHPTLHSILIDICAAAETELYPQNLGGFVYRLLVLDYVIEDRNKLQLTLG